MTGDNKLFEHKGKVISPNNINYLYVLSNLSCSLLSSIKTTVVKFKWSLKPGLSEIKARLILKSAEAKKGSGPKPSNPYLRLSLYFNFNQIYLCIVSIMRLFSRRRSFTSQKIMCIWKERTIWALFFLKTLIKTNTMFNKINSQKQDKSMYKCQ